MIKNCECCGAEYVPTKGCENRQKYCCKKCNDKAKNKRNYKYIKREKPLTPLQAQVKELRMLGKCSSEIAEALNRSVNDINRVVKTIQMPFTEEEKEKSRSYGSCKGWQGRTKKDKGLSNIISERTQGRFVYISGFTDTDHRAFLYCNDCGNVSFISMQFLKPSRELQTVHCVHCKQILEEAKAREKKQRRTERETVQTENRRKKEAERAERSKRNCKECGKQFFSLKRSFCSEDCSKKYNNRYCSRRKDKRFEHKSNITWKRIAKKQGNLICALCGEECNVNDYKVINGTVICGNLFPSVDHIIPCACGGSDSWDNVQLAHRGCNSRKQKKSKIKIVNGQFAINF